LMAHGHWYGSFLGGLTGYSFFLFDGLSVSVSWLGLVWLRASFHPLHVDSSRLAR
jgi:hypothetical protein